MKPLLVVFLLSITLVSCTIFTKPNNKPDFEDYKDTNDKNVGEENLKYSKSFSDKESDKGNKKGNMENKYESETEHDDVLYMVRSKQEYEALQHQEKNKKHNNINIKNGKQGNKNNNAKFNDQNKAAAHENKMNPHKKTFITDKNHDEGITKSIFSKANTMSGVKPNDYYEKSNVETMKSAFTKYLDDKNKTYSYVEDKNKNDCEGFSNDKFHKHNKHNKQYKKHTEFSKTSEANNTFKSNAKDKAFVNVANKFYLRHNGEKQTEMNPSNFKNYDEGNRHKYDDNKHTTNGKMSKFNNLQKHHEHSEEDETQTKFPKDQKVNNNFTSNAQYEASFCDNSHENTSSEHNCKNNAMEKKFIPKYNDVNNKFFYDVKDKYMKSSINSNNNKPTKHNELHKVNKLPTEMSKSEVTADTNKLYDNASTTNKDENKFSSDASQEEKSKENKPFTESTTVQYKPDFYYPKGKNY